MPRSLIKAKRLVSFLHPLLLRAQWPHSTLRLSMQSACLLIDRGPFSDRHEDGVDLNLESSLRPDGPKWRVTHLGTHADFERSHQFAYGGPSRRLHDTPRGFLDGIVGLAIHDDP